MSRKPPLVDEIQPMPKKLTKRVTKALGEVSEKASLTKATVDEWLDAQTEGARSPDLASAVSAVTSSGMGHDDMLAAVTAIVKLGSSGSRGVADALTEARSTYLADFPRHAKAWDEAVAGSVRRFGLPPTYLPIEAPDGAELLDRIAAFLGRFIAYPSEDAHAAHALWIAHAHVIECFDTTPRIAFVSPEPGSGKTGALERTKLLVPRPILTTSATSAYIVRKINDEAGLPVILQDEFDAIFGRQKDSSNEELRATYNSGYRRGAVVGRAAVRGKVVVTEEFPSFCAVGFAGLNDLPDTISSRAIVIHMKKRRADEKIEPFRSRIHEPEAELLKADLAAWATVARETLGVTYPELPGGIEDRNAEIWEPLVAIADELGGPWPERARDAAVAFVTEARDRPGTLGIALLSDVRRLFGDRKRMRTTDLLGELLQLDDSPWADLGGKGPIDGRFLGKTFARYDIPLAHSIRFDNHTTARGWNRNDFHDAFDRYLPALVETAELIPTPTKKNRKKET